MKLLPLLLLPLTILALPDRGGGKHHPPRNCEPSCKDLSLTAPTLDIEGFRYYASYTYTNPAHLVASGSVGFNVTNPMTGTTTTCYQGSTWLQHFFYGVRWYECDDGTQWKYSAISHELNINATWTCEEETPKGKKGKGRGRNKGKGKGKGKKAETFVFNGTATVGMEVECEEDYRQDPDWQANGGFYSTRQITCTQPLTVITPQVVLIE